MLDCEVVLHAVGQAQVGLDCLGQADSGHAARNSGEDAGKYYSGGILWIGVGGLVDQERHSAGAGGARNDVIVNAEG